MHMLRSPQDRARLCCEPEEISSSSVLRANCQSHVLLAGVSDVFLFVSLVLSQ
jgi:hypothetical protein